MISTYGNYIIDAQGNKQAIILSMAKWDEILEALEELDDIRVYDKAKKEPSDLMPFEQAVREIQEGRQI
jgi:hypothetical protein